MKSMVAIFPDQELVVLVTLQFTEKSIASPNRSGGRTCSEEPQMLS